ncbi:SRPBCC family protein [Qipengyuania sp. ASV99]|uniref:SRPBCC family protein n=1 Tax=Qipengyuania sp. ASV99 TaxID=3399681 RepID=UPI003A4C54BC
MRRSIISLTGAALAFGALPAQAEVVEAGQDHFITRAEAVVEADPKATWLALISPARWWSSEHTWSADAANLSLTPQAGGCFCERIPEVNEPGRFTLEGSVEHMRVVQAYPEVALRMVGALGPLQSEPVTGVLTVAISETEEGTRIVWEYNVGGQMRYPVPAISRAVDGVMNLQLSGLSQLLGQVRGPEMAPAADAPEAESEADASAAAAPETTSETDAETDATDAPVSIDPETVIGEGPGSPSVDDAFGDLSDG